MSDQIFGDPLTAPFWRAAAQRRLMLQHCEACGARQHYPRPMCLACDHDVLTWQEVPGTGTVYSLTTVRIPVLPELPPPYVLGIVTLDAGPRMLTHVLGDSPAVGDRVTVEWRDREGQALPVFRTTKGTRDGNA